MDTGICLGTPVDLLLMHIPVSLRFALVGATIATVAILGVFLYLWFAAFGGFRDSTYSTGLNVAWLVLVIFTLVVAWLDFEVVVWFINEWDKAQYAYDVNCVRPLMHLAGVE